MNLPLPNPIVVEVRDAGGRVVAGATVVFTPPLGSSVTPESTVTDASGRVATTWT
ncbi:MAG: Ig-like domain-containing protein, partial [Gemmatimonadetes bacterium]|nr:Ig-like domain-containing protein [Gemmatimonadota bacterium]